MTPPPDFIIIGAMKCATSTLHEQLAGQPGIFMTSPKEPNFFSDDDQWSRGPGWYHGLFEGAAPDDLRGESSTHYTKLPTYPDTVERMQAQVSPGVRLIYIMRHPIDRLVSHYMHEWSQLVIDCDLDEAVERHPQLVAYGRYAMQLAPFLRVFGRDAVLPVFFDRLAAGSEHQQSELDRVCGFIGYGGRPEWREEVAQQNVSRERLRRSRLRDAVVNFPGCRMLRRTLVPQSIRDRIKRLWTPPDRPEPSSDRRRELEAVFDEDLARLGGWLGLELRCDNFKSQGRVTAAQWAGESVT